MYGSFTIRSRDRTEEFPVRQAVVNVGRAADNDLSLPYATVSLHHARVLADASGCGVMDLGSSNGTRLNGVEIPIKVVQQLREGDLVEIGPFELRFRASRGSVAAPAQARPSASAAGAAAARPGAGRTVVLPPDLPARLVVSTPEGTREFPLKKDSVTLGREADNDIVVEAEAVSRHHAVLKRRGPAFLITDLGSTNGLSVAGEPVKEKLLTPGDYVCIGDFWSAGVALVDIIAHIGDMIQYKTYNLKSPVNKDAAAWARRNLKSFPVGARTIIPAASEEPSAPIVIEPQSASNDLDISLGPVRERHG